MNWTQHPSVIDQLAAAYVAGTLRGPARRRFEAALQRHPALVDAVNHWTARLGPLHTALPPHATSAALWPRIARSTGLAPAPAPAAVSTPWWRRLLAPVPVAALAMGLVVGTVVPVVWQARLDAQREMELPDSYVGVLATAKGEPGLIVSSLRRGKVVDLKQLTPIEVPQGKTLFLWRIDKAGAITAVAPLPSGQFTRVTLDEPAEQVFFPAVELAVSLETAGATPAIPTQPFVYRGLCGKLWR
ncbi:MAG: hypothetical protein CVU36_17395 [Betaproteobacteria bacterium HGW-Betaproteobacteria-9]|jgi:anti-sigma-K factor RskA|nr:MAG: hypothetical protein CVU36_17395 [Betaproteobacteria bacterium HGW-Betaproteobacteria-9]